MLENPHIRFGWLRVGLYHQFRRGRAILGDRCCDMLRSDMGVLKHQIPVPP